MNAQPSLSRISKLWTDRDQTRPDEALALRRAHQVVLLCGADIGASRTLQLAALTAARIAKRCFPGAVRAVVPRTAYDAACLIEEGRSFGEALAGILSASMMAQTSEGIHGRSIVFGDVTDAPGNALRATFDGWIGAAGPVRSLARMAEREYCSLAGLLCAAFAVSEIFMALAGISLGAGRRTIGLSLWRPDLAIGDPAALGPKVEFLPREAWLLGLGHLGNAYLWALATLPYPVPADVRFYLLDFDKVEDTNLETGVLFEPGDEEGLKTRVIDRWLMQRGFDTRLVERRFDEHFRMQGNEARLAFCGFDNNAARRHLAGAGFGHVVENGLGGKVENFDTISLHTFPQARSADDLWPDPDPADIAKEERQNERIARENGAYANLDDDICGKVRLAGKSIAVPFVGVTAAALVVAEALRLFHENGPWFGQVKFRLGTAGACAATYLGEYPPERMAGIPYVKAG